MLDNTRDIINNLRKRSEIASRIGLIKVKNGKGIRDRDREIEIIRELGYDRFTQLVLNTLFEYSINYEIEKSVNGQFHVDKIENDNEYIVINGTEKGLISMLPMVIPLWSTVFVKNNTDIFDILSYNGIHLINKEFTNPDMYISMKKHDGSGIIIDNGTMMLSRFFIENRENIYMITIR